MKRGDGLNKVLISFESVKDLTLGELYGTEPVPITQLTKRIWALIKEKGLQIKKS